MTSFQDALGRQVTLPDAEGTAASPVVGELWLTSWEGGALALVVVGAVRDGYVLGWPVTVSTRDDTYPSVPFGLSATDGSDVGLVAWPDAEFGMSTALLDTCYGAPFDAKTVRLIVGAVSGDCDMPVPACENVPSEAAEADLERVCAQAWDLGDIEWPLSIPGHGVLDQDEIRKSGVDARALAGMLHVSPARAASLAAGRAVPTQTELEALESLDLHRDSMFTAPSGAEVEAIVHPRFKSRIVAVTRQERLSEAAVRTWLYSEAEPLAARHQPGRSQADEAAARVEAALDRLLQAPRS